MTDEPHRMLPLCSVCGQRVSLSGALHDGKAWQCLSHTKVEQPTCHICQGQMSRGLYEAAQWTCMRCWGGWLAGAPEPKDPGRFEIASVTFEPKPGALDWSGAE